MRVNRRSSQSRGLGPEVERKGKKPIGKRKVDISNIYIYLLFLWAKQKKTQKVYVYIYMKKKKTITTKKEKRKGSK